MFVKGKLSGLLLLADQCNIMSQNMFLLHQYSETWHEKHVCYSLAFELRYFDIIY